MAYVVPNRRDRPRGGRGGGGGVYGGGRGGGGGGRAQEEGLAGSMRPSSSPAAPTLANVKSLSGHKKKVSSVGWNGDGRRLASCGPDATVRVWHWGTHSQGDCEREFGGHTGAAEQLCWDPTSVQMLASASADKTVRLWDARASAGAATIATPGENIYVEWSPDGSTLAVVNRNDQLSFIDARTNEVRCSVQFKSEVNEICWNNAMSLFFIAGADGNVDVYEFPGADASCANWGSSTGRALRLHAFEQNVVCMSCDRRDDKHFAVAGADAIVSLWDVSEMVCVRTFDRMEWPVRSLSFSHDSSMLAIGSEDEFVEVADTASGEPVKKLEIGGACESLEWHPTQNLLAFACDGGKAGLAKESVHVWSKPAESAMAIDE